MPAATSAKGFKSEEIFDMISNSLAEEGKALVGKVKGIYAFKVKGGPDGAEGFWIVDAKNGSGAVEFNGKGDGRSIAILTTAKHSWQGHDVDIESATISVQEGGGLSPGMSSKS